jgi:hypothetical protein
VNNACLIFQKDSFHYLSTHYVVDLLMIGLKNSNSRPLLFHPLSPFCFPTQAQKLLETLATSSAAKYPTCPVETVKRKRNNDDDDNEFFPFSSTSKIESNCRTHRSSNRKKNLDFYYGEDLEESNGEVTVIQV